MRWLYTYKYRQWREITVDRHEQRMACAFRSTQGQGPGGQGGDGANT